MIKLNVVGFIVLSSVLSYCTQVTSAENKKEGEMEVVWQDDFKGTDLNTDKWTPIIGNGCPENCGFGNNELQYYQEQAQNITISDGTLKITAYKDSVNEQSYTSAKLVSKTKGDWKYGRIEVKAKLPEGKGTWPAIWMLPTLDRKMNWPLDGEIDIMEHVGYNQGMVYGTIHTKKYNHIEGTQKSDSIYLEDASEVFHVYGLDWDQEKMIWSVDGQEYLTITKDNEDYKGWPFDQEYHLILNLAVGGNWGGKYGVDDSIWPQNMEIDYVKVYQKQ